MMCCFFVLCVVAVCCFVCVVCVRVCLFVRCLLLLEVGVWCVFACVYDVSVV